MADDFDDDQDPSEGIKNLRKQYDKLQKELEEERKARAELAARDRKRTIADKLTELGASAKVANFVPGDLELDKLPEWLTDNADVFGFKVQTPDSPADDAERQALDRISRIEPRGGSEGPNPDIEAVLAAKTADELTAMIHNAVMGRR